MISDNEAIAAFSSYSLTERKEFLAHLLYELTIVARDNYEVEGNGLTDSQRARCINEIQHRVSAFLWSLLRGDARHYPDDVLIKIILEQPGDPVLERQLSEAFARVATHHASVA